MPHLCVVDFFHDIRLGLSGFLRAFAFARRHGMSWMFLIPALLWILLAFGLFAVLEGPAGRLGDRLAILLEIPVDPAAGDWWSDLKAFLNGAREFVLGWILKLAIAYLLFVANKYIVLVCLSPLLAYASERTEEVLTGRTFPFSWRLLLKDALRGALIAVRNGSLELAITVGLWALTFLLPIIAPFSFILLFTVSSYFYGFSMFDYVHERRRMRIGESVRAVNERIGSVLANGALFSLLMKLPLLGMMLAPVMAAIGAVLTTVRWEGHSMAGDHSLRNPQRRMP